MENPGINLFEVGLDLLGNGMGASGGVGVEGDVVVELGFVGVELGEFHQITNFLKTPLALLGVDLKNFQFNKICHFANYPYLCKGLIELNISFALHGIYPVISIIKSVR